MIENISIFRGGVGEVVIPVDSGYVDFRLAGSGEVTSRGCSTFSYVLGCDRVELHNHIGLDGVNYSGKVYVKRVFMSCDKPSCPKCSKFGWAVREGRKVEARLAEGSKHYGLVLHITVSIPLEWYRLPYPALVKRVEKALEDRGIIGGALIFHRDRFRGPAHGDPYWSFHFHTLCLAPAISKCRACKRTCFKGCGGFVDRNYRCGEKDGCLVKVLGKRKTVGGTAWYQLNHASYRVSMKRANVVRWFGVCSYRKLKVTVEKHSDICPACGHDLIKLLYFGSDPEVVAWLYACRNSEVKSVRSGWFDAFEDGRQTWVPDSRG